MHICCTSFPILFFQIHKLKKQIEGSLSFVCPLPNITCQEKSNPQLFSLMHGGGGGSLDKQDGKKLH